MQVYHKPVLASTKEMFFSCFTKKEDGRAQQWYFLANEKS